MMSVKCEIKYIKKRRTLSFNKKKKDKDLKV